MLNAASFDSEASQPVEARPSSDPLPATVSPIQEPGQPLHQSSISSTPVPAAPMAASEKGAMTAGSAAPMPHLADTSAGDSTDAQPSEQPDSKLGCVQSQQAQPKQVAQPMPLHHQGQHKLESLQQLEGSSADIPGTDWDQANGHGAEPLPPASTQQDGVLGNETSITDEDDAALLADMQGFASALGCDWQVRCLLPACLVPRVCIQPATTLQGLHGVTACTNPQILWGDCQVPLLHAALRPAF